MTAALSGLRILDFSRVLSGPFASMHLADLGADVVKVEHPSRGDDTRSFGPPFTEGVSTYFLSVNRGKRSIALDLKDEDDRKVALQLAQRADVVLENFRPGVMDRLGLGYAALSAANPGIVYCAISGFGQEAGPRPGYDLVIQGLSGIPHLTGAPDTAPFKCGASVADLVAGLNAVQGILAAIVRRERTGEGGFVDVSMIDAQRALLTYHASAWLNGDKEPTRIGNAHPSIHPFCAYPASDGYINVAIGNDALWARLLDVLQGVDADTAGALGADTRFAHNAQRVEHREALNRILTPVFQTHSVAEWRALLDGAGIPSGPIATVPQALETSALVEHPHPAGGKPVRTLPPGYLLDNAPRTAERRAPALGEHNADVLDDWLNPRT